jgi:hypothetical protein
MTAFQITNSQIEAHKLLHAIDRKNSHIALKPFDTAVQAMCKRLCASQNCSISHSASLVAKKKCHVLEN